MDGEEILWLLKGTLDVVNTVKHMFGSAYIKTVWTVKDHIWVLGHALCINIGSMNNAMAILFCIDGPAC
jgi:hypothetical protein